MSLLINYTHYNCYLKLKSFQFEECIDVRNSLPVDHMLDRMTINLLVKELADWNATPCRVVLHG